MSEKSGNVITRVTTGTQEMQQDQVFMTKMLEKNAATLDLSEFLFNHILPQWGFKINHNTTLKLQVKGKQNSVSEPPVYTVHPVYFSVCLLSTMDETCF